MNWKSVLRDYFVLSRKDRVAALCMASLLLALFLVPRFYAPPTALSLTEDTALRNMTDTLQQHSSSATTYESGDDLATASEPLRETGYTHGRLFTFDPNTLPTEGWQQLGLNHRVIKTINNYRNKGGRFYKREDLQKIWGLPKGFYERVADYIAIEKPEPIKNYTTPALPAYEKREQKIAVVDINEADTGALIALPGIGSKLAARVVAFRNKLGGFYTVQQIGETYGLPDSTFQQLKPYLKVNPAAVKKWNINTATKDDLKTHPYIRWTLANAIVEYRNAHGAYKSLQELKNIMLIDEPTFERVLPYLTL